MLITDLVYGSGSFWIMIESGCELIGPNIMLDTWTGTRVWLPLGLNESY